jgi:predicted dinucleotide-binding enzyme
VAAGTSASVASLADALAGADAVLLVLPGSAVAELVADHGPSLTAKLVIAANQMGGSVTNSRAALPSEVRYARAFNTLGGENLADPDFADGPADMFFSGPEADRALLEEVIAGVGLRPVYVGADQEELIDAQFRLWVALAIVQGRGRRLAFRLLES